MWKHDSTPTSNVGESAISHELVPSNRITNSISARALKGNGTTEGQTKSLAKIRTAPKNSVIQSIIFDLLMIPKGESHGSSANRVESKAGGRQQQ